MSLPLITTAPTIAHLLAERFETGGDRVALHAQLPDGVFQAITWRQLRLSVDTVVGVLLNLGVQPGDRVAQLSENRLEWVLLDFACAVLQAVHVPLHASLAGEQAVFEIAHSGAQVLAVSSRQQAQKLVDTLPVWPHDIAVLGYAECGDLFGAAWRGTLPELCQQTIPGASFEVIKDYAASLQPSTLATILYTSGTTGEPKGVMLTHGNLASNAIAAVVAFGDHPDEKKLNFLPLSHIFARTCDLYGWLVRGGELWIASSREKLFEEIAQFQPTVLNGVPYFYERVQRMLVEKQVAHLPGVLRKTLGGAIRFCNSGGAALPRHLFDYYHEQGVPLLEGYGLSETSPVLTLSTVEHFRRGSCGRAIAGVELRIDDDSEILTRGPQIMPGYWHDEKATLAVLQDGWFHTGDIGRLDDDGYLYITGRKKELLVTSGGRNIAPVYLEGLLTARGLIAQAVVVGDAHGYIAALLVPNLQHQQIRELLADSDLTTRTLEHAALRELVEQHVAECLHGVSQHEQVRRFVLLTQPLTIENGELTAKLSLRRTVIAERYAAEIAALYASQ